MINSKILACILSLSLLSGCTHFTKHDANPIPPENRLIVFTSHKPEVYAPIIKEFELRTGISVEVQAGGTTEMLEKIKNGEDVINKWVKELNLNIEERFKLSWDDKYTSLCKEQGITPVKDVIFDENIIMPKA